MVGPDDVKERCDILVGYVNSIECDQVQALGSTPDMQIGEAIESE